MRLASGSRFTAADIGEAVRKGAPATLRRDLYFYFIEGSWTRVFAAFGVIFLLIVARKVWRGDYDVGRRGFFTSRRGDYESVEIMGLYWHFVDLVWVFIFAFFYLW